jgi:hypothetical protein
MQTRLALIGALILAAAVTVQAAEEVRPAHHANAEHPAVQVARQRQTVDPNTFLVQPPASVTWTVQAEPKVVASTDVAVKGK